jgi:hypothetical protein
VALSLTDLNRLDLDTAAEDAMDLPPLVSDIYQVVVRGDFKPVNVSPAWLRDQDLIGDPEHEEATFEVLLPNEIAIFNAGWIRCQATPDNLTLQTDQQAEVGRLRDLAIGILRAFDKPVSLLGINRTVHFSLRNTKQWHSVGDHIVHNEIWDGILTLPGMRVATYWGQRSDKYAGRIQVQIEPSFQVHPGIFVGYNDHYDLTTVESQPTTRTEFDTTDLRENTEVTIEKVAVAIEVLTNQWEPSLQLSTRIIERTAEQAR